MSYCRWSSDNWKSDVYVYACVDGTWVTHVAGRRRVGVEQLPDDPLTLVGSVPSEEWQRLYKEHHAILESLPFEDIDHPKAGETYHDDTPGDCASRLRELRADGFAVPDYAIEELEREHAEEHAA